MKKVFSLLFITSVCLAVLAGCSFGPIDFSGSDTDSTSAGIPTDTEPASTGIPTDTEATSAAVPTETEADDSPLYQLRDKMRSEDCTVGIAFIDYVDGESTEEALKDLVKSSSLCQKYPFFEDCSLAMTAGQELYAIVPAGEDDCITVFEAGINESGEYADYRDRVIFEGRPGEPLVLRCNVSEVYSNVLVSVGISGDAGFEFRPFLSGMDGSLVMKIGMYDLEAESGQQGLSGPEEGQGFLRNYLFDMAGEWWSEPRTDKNGLPVYYRIQLESPDWELNCFELSAGDSFFTNLYGTYSLTDSYANEYSYIMYSQEEEFSGKFILARDGDRLVVRESGGDGLFFLTEDDELAFSFRPYQELGGYDTSVQFAYEMLRLRDEIQYYVGHFGMELIYMDEYQEINGENCMIFALESNLDGQFVCEYFYAYSDDGNTYCFDAESGQWVGFGEG